MTLLITAWQPSIHAPVHARFGRAPYFAVVDIADEEWSFHRNPGLESDHDCGIAAACFAADLGADAIVCGGVGPKALRALDAHGVAVYCASGISVTDAFAAFRLGGLVQVRNPTEPQHAGLGLLERRQGVHTDGSGGSCSQPAEWAASATG